MILTVYPSDTGRFEPEIIHTTYPGKETMYRNKSTLERVSNLVYCSINGVFRELRHDSAMNIILRPGVSS